MKNGFAELAEKLYEFFVKTVVTVLVTCGYKPDIPPESYSNLPSSGWSGEQ